MGIISHTEELNNIVYSATSEPTLKQASLRWTECLKASSCYMLLTRVPPCYEQVESKLQFLEIAFKYLTDSSTDFRQRVSRSFMMCVR